MPLQLAFTWEAGSKQSDEEIIHWAIPLMRENLVLKVISTLAYLVSLTKDSSKRPVVLRRQESSAEGRGLLEGLSPSALRITGCPDSAQPWLATGSIWCDPSWISPESLDLGNCHCLYCPYTQCHTPRL